MSLIRQTSFAGGELAPDLYNRPDLPKYKTGLRRARNFYVNKKGELCSRMGTQHYFSTKLNADARLVPFDYLDGVGGSAFENYLLEFGDSYVRIYQNGGTAHSDITTPYVAADLHKLKFTQSGDSLFITCQGYAQRILRHSGPTTWSLFQIGLTPATAGSLNSGSGWVNSPYLARWIGGTTYAFGDQVVNADGNIYICSSSGTAAPNGGPTGTGAAITDGGATWKYTDGGYDAKVWRLAFSLVFVDTKGIRTESLPTDIQLYSPDAGATTFLLPNDVALSISQGRPLTWHVKWGALPNTIVGALLYRGAGDVMGLVGSLDASGDFVDYGIEPDYSQPPRTGEDPFTSSTGVSYFHSIQLGNVTTDYPGCVTFFEDRLTFAATPNRPAGIDFSASGDYFNFDKPQVRNDAQSLQFNLASRRREEIKNAVGGRKLLLWSNNAAWSFSGSGGPLSPTSVQSKLECETGSTDLPPILVESSAVFERSKGYGVRALTFDFQRDGYAPADVSVFAQHLFDGNADDEANDDGPYNIVSWAYASEPDSIIWAVRDDGRLLSLTLSPEHELIAWCLHETDGDFKQVCVLHEGGVDRVYFVVARANAAGAVGYYVEQMADLRIEKLEIADDGTVTNEPVCLDSAYKQFTAGTPGSVYLGGLARHEGKEIYALADGVLVGPLLVTGGVATLPEGANSIVYGLLVTSIAETLDASEGKDRDKQCNRVFVDVLQSRGLEAGPDEGHLSTYEQRDVDDSYDFVHPMSGTMELQVDGHWARDGGRVVLKHEDGFPLIITGLSRQMDGGGPNGR